MLEKQIKALGDIFRYLNESKFDGRLNEKTIITIQSQGRKKNAAGWCSVYPIWINNKEENFYEINISAEYLGDGLLEVCGIMLHEMVHLANLQSGIKDCNSKTQYHNKCFKDLAESVGLVVKRVKKYGYGITSLSDKLKNELNSLDIEDVFNIRRDNFIAVNKDDNNKSKKKKRIHKYTCNSCGAEVKSKIFGLEIRCEECGVNFEEEKNEEDE